MDYFEGKLHIRKEAMTWQKFEKLAAEIFQSSGFEVPTSTALPNFDFMALNGDKKFFIEVKSSTTVKYRNLEFINQVIARMTTVAHNEDAIPVLVVFAVVDEKDKEKFAEEYEDLIILDLANLLYATRGTNLQEQMVALLPFSVDRIEPEAGSLELGWAEHANKEASLELELKNCLAGRTESIRFEKACCEMLKFIFAEDLSLWREQSKSNKELYRFDLLCRIKDDTGKTVWSMIEKFFNSKYIVFEFKNHTERITQKEVYTTERYLYKKALRSVAIIISQIGNSENALWAAKGCLRENGKLILLLSAEDLLDMYNAKVDRQDPTEILLSKIDDLLMDLEK